MEAGGKDCEEETLQTAFKKLRVDAESLPGAVSVSEALAPRAASRACPDTSGAKPKLSCPKDNWHGCMRKSSRGASRTQRRRRSKSPILHPPKFTYCSAAAASTLSLTSGCLKHQRLAVPNPAEPPPAVDRRATSPAPKDPSSSGHISPLAFGLCAGYERHAGASSQEILGVVSNVTASLGQDGGDVQLSKASVLEESACGGTETRATAAAATAQTPGTTEASDFRALSQLHSSGGGGSSSAEGSLTTCACKKSSDSREAGGQGTECQCQSSHPGWAGVEVYSFTGLRSVISECETSLQSHEDTSRTLSATSAAATSALSPSSLSSGSPRSCSEQARSYVDDVTIEDLSGYMEYYLYIPKKMSHMAEMMYT